MADKTTQLVIPDADPHNVQATKYYIFNETGNIMMASTDQDSSEIQQSVRDIFAEVSVFFAAMTRAITTTNNPETDQPYSLYNYTALEKILGGSGLFAWVTREDIEHTTQSVGVSFSTQLIEGLLGLATGAGALSFAQGMLASMGDEGLKIGVDKERSDSKVGNVVFVCEYLLGMPTVSVIVVYIDAKESISSLKIGPCFSETEVETTWKMHKDTYLFVTPKFVREYSADLDSVAANEDFSQFVEYLRSVLEERPMAMEVHDAATKKKVDELETGGNYLILGANLQETVSVAWGTEDVLEVGQVLGTQVEFSVKDVDAPTGKHHVDLLDAEDQTLTRTESFAIKKGSKKVERKTAPPKAARRAKRTSTRRKKR